MMIFLLGWARGFGKLLSRLGGRLGRIFLEGDEFGCVDVD